MVLIRLTSDNFDNQLCTVDAYVAIVLTMSTGDHATHKAEVVVCPDFKSPYHDSNKEILTMADINGGDEFIECDEDKGWMADAA